MVTRQQLGHGALFCLLFIVTHFINKYVLSVLSFTFPTIFQGWQTLVGAIVLKILISTGHVEPLLENCNRHEVALWLPGMLLFVISIYSGSIALANLSIPVFFAFQNLLSVMDTVCNMAYRGRSALTWLCMYVINILIIISALMTGRNDPQYSKAGYFWMCIHILSLGGLDVYSKIMKGRLKLSMSEKLYCNYIYSVILLAPSSYFLGDAMAAKHFEHLYLSKFYISCFLSGLFGVFLMLTYVKLREETPPVVSAICTTIVIDTPRWVNIGKISSTILSLYMFPDIMTVPCLTWSIINQLATTFSSEHRIRDGNDDQTSQQPDTAVSNSTRNVQMHAQSFDDTKDVLSQTMKGLQS